MARSFGTLRVLDHGRLDDIKTDYEIPKSVDLEVFIQATAFKYDQSKKIADKLSPSKWRKEVEALSGAIRKLTDMLRDRARPGVNLVHNEIEELVSDWGLEHNKNAYKYSEMSLDQIVGFLEIVQKKLENMITKNSQFHEENPEFKSKYRNGLDSLTQGTRYPHLYIAFNMMKGFWETLPESQTRGNFTYTLKDSVDPNNAIKFANAVIKLIDPNVPKNTINSQMKNFCTRIKKLRI